MCEGQVAETPGEGALRGVQLRRWPPAAPPPALTPGSLGCKSSEHGDPPPLRGRVLGLPHPPGAEIFLISSSGAFAAGDVLKSSAWVPREALPSISWWEKRWRGEPVGMEKGPSTRRLDEDILASWTGAIARPKGDGHEQDTSRLCPVAEFLQGSSHGSRCRCRGTRLQGPRGRERLEMQQSHHRSSLLTLGLKHRGLVGGAEGDTWVWSSQPDWHRVGQNLPVTCPSLY